MNRAAEALGLIAAKLLLELSATMGKVLRTLVA